MRRVLVRLLVVFILAPMLFAPVAIVQGPTVDNTLVVCVATHPDDIEIAASGSLFKSEIGAHPILWLVVTDGGADFDEYNYESNSGQGWIAQDGQFDVAWEAPDGSNITRSFYSADLAKKRCGGSFEGLNWVDEAASHNSTFGVAYDWRTRVSGFVDADIERVQMGYLKESNPGKRLSYPDGGLALAANAFRDSIAANLANKINQSVVFNGYQKSLLRIYSHAAEEVCTNAGEHPDHQVVGNAVRQAIELLLTTYGFGQIDAKWFTVYDPIDPKSGYVRVDEDISLQQTQKVDLAKLCWETESVHLRHVNYTWTDFPTDPGTYEWSIVHSYYMGMSNSAVYLLLTVEPNRAVYSKGQALTVCVTVFNDNGPALESSLTLTATGPEKYGFYDMQPVSVAAGEVREYSFSWDVPDVAGSYMVEASVVPPQLTAYDAVWLEAG